ncbi:MAG: hypothetical protein HC877_20665 [Thioploca sp.]|nr:hypothetical protein [Thioploca sp.]
MFENYIKHGFLNTIQPLQSKDSAKKNFTTVKGVDDLLKIKHLFYSILMDPEHNPELKGNKWRGTPYTSGIVQRMERDDKVPIAEQLRIAPILNNKVIWKWKPNARGFPEDIQLANLCHDIFEELKIPLLTGLLKAHRYGFSHIEFKESYRDLSKDKYPDIKRTRAVVFTGVREIPGFSVYDWTPDINDISMVSKLSIEQIMVYQHFMILKII